VRAGGGPPVLSVDPDPGELAIVAIEARQNPHMPDTVTLSLLDRPGGQPVAVVYGTPEGLKAMAEAVLGALGLLEVAPEGSVDYVARIGEPRRD
jgi:hypothetical protein